MPMSDSTVSTKLSKNKRTRLTFPFGACRVCSDSATGIHYGIATCEGCKGFFKRSILRKEKYRCYFDNACLINVVSRNRCKACRFRRCIDEGMSVDGVKMGRIPKLVKEKALQELKEQKLKEEAAQAKTNDKQSRSSSFSSISDQSIENYDPNAMETDSTDSQASSIQRHGDVTKTRKHSNGGKKTSSSSSIYDDQMIVPSDSSPTIEFSSSSSQSDNSTVTEIKSPVTFEQQNSTKMPIKYPTKYPTYLPEDFTVDETVGVIDQNTGLLNTNELSCAQAIAKKLNGNWLTFNMELNEDEELFIRYLRSSAYDIYQRRSKRLKQLMFRMNQMIKNNISEYPGDKATLLEFYESIRLCCQVYTRSTVLYMQELPGMRNISLKSLQTLLSHRAFDWYLLKYHQLYNDNGECYLLGPTGFQHTRYWMDQLHNSELSDAMFSFCKRIRQLDLSETEFALVLPLHMCYYDSSMEDKEIPQMLRSCYLYALYTELWYHRGEGEAKAMCRKILQALELLIPLTALYRREVASRILEI